MREVRERKIRGNEREKTFESLPKLARNLRPFHRILLNPLFDTATFPKEEGEIAMMRSNRKFFEPALSASTQFASRATAEGQ